MTAQLDDQGNCENVTVSALDLDGLIELLQFTTQSNMRVFIGLLDLDTDAPYEWGNCAQDYAIQQGIAMTQVIQAINQEFNNSNVDYAWYITQEAALNDLEFGTDGNCSNDGETVYYMLMLNEMSKNWDRPRDVMFSPYWTNSSQTLLSAQNLGKMMSCAELLTLAAPQDGVGSFNRTLDETAAAWQLFALYKPQNINQTLWANVETFLFHAEICEAAPQQRIEDQVASVDPYAVKVINFWAYNLPGAPSCPQ